MATTQSEAKKPAAKAAAPKTENTRSRAVKKPQDHQISITSDVQDIDINLVGENYIIHPPKMIVMLNFTKIIKDVEGSPEKILEVIDTYIESAFSTEDQKKVKARLSDPQDQLDLTHMMQLIEQVTEISSGNLTT